MTNQQRVGNWIRQVFTQDELYNSPERCLRVLEEATELAQAFDISREQAHKLVDYVYNRPVGDCVSEVAGVMVTLYALTEVCAIDAQAAFEAEIIRISKPEVIARVQRRQSEKREALK